MPDTPPQHGGNLRTAAQRFAIPLAQWLDLSTAINPQGYCPPAISAAAWARLPEADDGLERAAAACYQSHALLPVAGSQAAIAALPDVLPDARRIAHLQTTYAEYAYAWRHRQCLPCADSAALAAAVPTADVVIVARPNNPTGELLSCAQLMQWHDALYQRNGWLIVDEAFIDASAGESLVVQHRACERLIVLRSVGKFFGLAGARAGFVFAPPPLLKALAQRLGPWTLSGPTREAVRAALGDEKWQQNTRRRLQQDSLRLHRLLTKHQLAPDGGCALFQWVRTAHAQHIQHALAQQGIWVRRFERPPSLRFGLPATATDWQRLDAALATASVAGR